MKEVEVKYRIKDKSAFFRLKEYFLNHFADRIYQQDQEEVRDYYYRTDDESSMRIRYLHRQDVYYRTIKGKGYIDKHGFKVRTEDERRIDVPSEDELSKSYLIIRKQREGYHFNHEKLFFDVVDGLGYFVELEYLMDDEKNLKPSEFIMGLLEEYGSREDKSYRKLGEEKFLLSKDKKAK